VLRFYIFLLDPLRAYSNFIYGVYVKYCSVFGYVTRLITSLCQGCSESLMNNHFHTVQLSSLYNTTVSGRLWPSLSFPCLRPSGLKSVFSGPDTGHRSPRFDLMSSAIRCFGNVSSHPLLLNGPSVSGETCLLSQAMAHCYCVVSAATLHVFVVTLETNCMLLSR
jgi:hypothetical protein